MHKKIPWAAALLILVAIGVIIFLFWPKAKLPEIKIADITILSFIDSKKGFFEKEGLQVKWEKVILEDRILALLVGETDYVIFPGLLFKPAIEASLRNAPIKIIALTARHQTYFLVTQPGLELKDIKTIGIFSRHDSLHYYILKFVKENSLEVEIIMPDSQKLSQAMKELEYLLSLGEVDAILSLPYFGFQLQAQGFSVLETIIDEAPSGLSVRNDKIEKKPKEVQKAIRAMERIMEFIITNPEETKKLILKLWNLEETKENLKIIEEYYPLLKATFDGKNTLAYEGTELLIKIVKAGEFETVQEVEEQIVTQEELDKVFDFRFVK